MEQIGSSVLGRPIAAHRIGPPGPPRALIFGAIHGDEPESAEVCQRLLGDAPADCAAWIVPCANPDGLEAHRKDNARGVDLNRNFPAKSWSVAHPPGYFPGEAPLSEPETRALAELIDRERPRVLIAVHQPFRCVNWDGPAEALAQEMAARTGYPAVASVGYPTPGSFGSYYGIDRALPVITLEMPKAPSESDFQGCLSALKYAMMFK